MKKNISIIAALTTCITLTACNNEPAAQKSRFEGISIVRGHTDYISFTESFSDVEKFSDFIVVGEFIDDSSVCYERYRHDDRFNKDLLVDIVSSCPMKITKVLYGDAKEGDVVNVLQQEGIHNDKFITLSPLTPMQKGDEWIFCLAYSNQENYEGYWCIGDSFGRYPTKNASSNEIMCFSDYPELGVYEKSDFYEDFYNELVEKYGI